MGAVVVDETGGAVLDESGNQITDDGVSSFFYLNDFIGANGSAPTDFTTSQVVASTGTIDVQSNQLRLLTSSTNFHTLRMVLPTSNWLDDDGALVVSYTPTTGFGQFNLILRGSGAWAAAGDVPTNGYTLVLNMEGAEFGIFRTNASVVTQVGSWQPYVWSTGSGYFTRFYTLGAQLKVKVWSSSVLEPEAWTYEVTDGTPYTTAGQLQMTFRTVSSAVRDLRVDAVGIQTLPVAGRASGTGTAYNATTTTSGAAANATAQPAVSVGAAEFEFDDSDSITLEIYTATPGGGAAYNATVTTISNVLVSAQSLSKTGTANNATVTRTGNGSATVGTVTGTAHAPTLSTTSGTVSVSAQVATGDGDATGITYILDENGLPILDENDLPIEDGAGLTIKVALGSNIAASTGASNAPTRSVSTRIDAAAGAGSAPQPSISSVGGSTSTNVNAAAATGAGAANTTTSLVSLTSATATASGAAEAPQTDIPVHAGVASSAGVAYDWEPITAQTAATSVGVAYDAQINVDSANFIAAAPIPVGATVPQALVGISVNAEQIIVTGTANTPRVGPADDETGQLVTVRDRGHTVTLKER